MDLALIGYCGVDCAACTDYAGKVCPGCRLSTWPEGDECPPVACCRKQDITCCGLCPTFPCDMMSEFYKESESHRTAGVLMASLRRQAEGKDAVCP